jgi:hypothetical protein
MKQEDKFNFFIPIEINDVLKANVNKKEEEQYDNMIVEGEASDNSEDSDEEFMEPNGFILDRFIRSGLVNYEHLNPKTPKNWFGDVIDAKILNNKLFVKAKLWSKSQLARDFWDTLKVMKESGSTRRPGWSIEGKKVKVDPSNPKRILSAIITNIALTFSPKNFNSYAAIAKGEYADAYIEPEFDETANGGAEYLLDITKPDGTRITIDKQFNVKIIEKAMSAGSETGTQLTNKDTNGASLKRESLKKKLINLQPDFIKSVIEIGKNIDKLDKKTQNNVRKRVKGFLID